MVSYSNDDSFEFFGGTVNAKHLIAFRGLDDDFDTDNGYSGKVQFAIAVRDPQVADISKSNGFESDNDANGSVTTPQTSAVFSNVTIVGPTKNTGDAISSLYQTGAHLRRNTSMSLFNSVILGYPIGILVDGSKGTPTDNNLNSGSIELKNIVLAGCTTALKYAANSTSPTGATDASINTWFGATAFKNAILTTTADAKIADAFNLTNPNYAPEAGSPLLNAADFTSTKLGNLTSVNYIGAVGSGDTWYLGWTKF
jgi:hypothetical protein